MTWQPRLGAWPEDGGVRFRVWAPDAERVEVEIEGTQRGTLPLQREDGGYHAGLFAGLSAGARYRYRLDGRGPFPDPCSRFQPGGVHGPSEVIDPTFPWSDADWPGIPLTDLVTYELHLGAFTPQGSFAAAAEALPRLAELGVTAIQLLPVADFAGSRGWGYDGVALFAPARCYGRPEELRGLVDRAHALGLAVILDVVYNHFGPDGAYHAEFSRQYFNSAHHTLWGSAVNLDGPGSEAVRDFFVESARHWLHEYHVDGFRLDSTHALVDGGPRHFLAEYAAAVHDATPRTHRPLVIAEDHRNLSALLLPEERGGFGLDAVLADDFHHELRRILAGDDEGYYADYRGDTPDLATCLAQGWLFIGQHAPYWNEPRGTDPTGLAPPHFVHCLQNHDQVGNRPFGDRLTATTTIEAFRAATAVLLTSADTPMLFMGQEWAASTPFQFFTDHYEELGRAVTAGRRSEFGAWSAFRDEAMRERIPDPQDPATFERSKLDWSERSRQPHAGVLALHERLLRLRHTEPALRWHAGASQQTRAADEDTVVLDRRNEDARVVLVARLRGGAGLVEVPELADGPWSLVLTTEEADFTSDPAPIEVTATGSCRFQRPGAVLLRRDGSPPP
ncbi:MAG: malto-oligosyltrehalose trehalohydrolase [Dehalococcoidia bacterium]|nr:malto-oligosyltrehalose trehalohydrolase [Dehalococcoidia bacterium]